MLGDKEEITTLLLESGSKGDIDTLKMLYHSGLKNLNDFTNIDERNIGHIAAADGQAEIIKYLKYTARLDFSQRDIWDRTPLDDAIHFKQNVRRTHDRHPAFEGRFALAHASFQRLLRVRLLRKHPNPHLAFALHVARDRHAAGFQLLAVHPATLQRHEPILAERNSVAARRQPRAAAAVHFAILYSGGHQWHNKVLFLN